MRFSSSLVFFGVSFLLLVIGFLFLLFFFWFSSGFLRVFFGFSLGFRKVLKFNLKHKGAPKKTQENLKT